MIEGRETSLGQSVVPRYDLSPEQKQKAEERREVRNRLYAKFKSEFVSTFLEMGLDPEDVVDEAALADDEIFEAFQTGSLLEEIKNQLNVKGVDTSTLGQDIP